MAEHTILTPEVIATIIGLIVLVGGGTAAAIMTGLRGWLIRGRDVLNLLIDAMEDGKFTAKEIQDIIDYLKEVSKDPQGAKASLHRKP